MFSLGEERKAPNLGIYWQTGCISATLRHYTNPAAKYLHTLKNLNKNVHFMMHVLKSGFTEQNKKDIGKASL